jgi:uncharacterized protein (TIGR02246 family)
MRRRAGAGKETAMVQQASNVREQIERANHGFVEAFNKGDVAGAVGVYTEDATILPPGSPRVHGRDGIRWFWQSVMDSGVRSVALQTDDLEVAGEMAREIGTATLTVSPEGGEEQTLTVKFVVVWKRQGDDWRWHTDIWNTDAP